jgi:hypothetical protein
LEKSQRLSGWPFRRADAVTADADDNTTVTHLPPIAIVELFRAMTAQSHAIMEESLSCPKRAVLQAESYHFLCELEQWVQTIESRPEALLVSRAAREYQFALLSLVQGHYGQAFKSLRLVLELILQTIHLSAHTLDLHEWLTGRKDTIWSALVSQDGVLSKRYADAFSPELREHVAHFQGLAQQLYRECSEAVHGNMQKHLAMPETLQFDSVTFTLWHEKSNVVGMTTTFALAMRYLWQISITDTRELENAVMSRLGHISAIRHFFGATGGE